MKIKYYETTVTLESESQAEEIQLEQMHYWMEEENPKFGRELRKRGTRIYEGAEKRNNTLLVLEMSDTAKRKRK